MLFVSKRKSGLFFKELVAENNNDLYIILKHRIKYFSVFVEREIGKQENERTGHYSLA